MQAKKKFGQNFINDPNLIKKIVDILPQEFDSLIIEIGPGKGALTKELVKRYKKVIAIEIDNDMKQILENAIYDKNLEVVIKDVLDVNLPEFIKNASKGFSSINIISNLPYYITSEILFKTLNCANLINSAVFMMQKEVALRLCADSGDNNYNNLSIACQFYADRKYEFTVKKQLFSPIPKVDSAVVSLKFNKKFANLVDDDKAFLVFLRKIFNNRRKTILNNLTNLTNDKNISKQILDHLKISVQLRPEVIRIEDFIKIFKELSK